MGTVKKLSFTAMSLALAVAIGFAESYIPMLVPGAKPGLGNIVLLLLLYVFSWKEAVFVALAKVILVSLLRGTFFDVTFFMSLCGTLLSVGVMVLARYVFRKLTVIGTSFLGSYLFALGQLAALSVYMQTPAVFYYFPLLSLVSLLTGFVTGFVAERILSNSYIKHLNQLTSR